MRKDGQFIDYLNKYTIKSVNSMDSIQARKCKLCSLCGLARGNLQPPGIVDLFSELKM